ncbi:hypothetical protein E4T42_05678 [Aureobasidium subglaciale]|nr:hypothetical protein E4T42_05678 [Aureobasidium subglaciale]
MPSFLSLPSELRLVIYSCLLDDAIASGACIFWAPDVLEDEMDTISVSYRRITPSAEDTFNMFGLPAALSHVDFSALAILGQASRLIRDEVMPLIWSCPDLSLHGQRSKWVEILRAVKSRQSRVPAGWGQNDRVRQGVMRAFILFLGIQFPKLQNLNVIMSSPAKCIIPVVYLKLPPHAKTMFAINNLLHPTVSVSYTLHIRSSLQNLVDIGWFLPSELKTFHEKYESLPREYIANCRNTQHERKLKREWLHSNHASLLEETLMLRALFHC